MTQEYHLICNGSLVEGYTIDQVSEGLSRVLKNDKQIATLLSGRKVTLKKSSQRNDLERHAVLLKQQGLKVSIVPSKNSDRRAANDQSLEVQQSLIRKSRKGDRIECAPKQQSIEPSQQVSVIQASSVGEPKNEKALPKKVSESHSDNTNALVGTDSDVPADEGTKMEKLKYGFDTFMAGGSKAMFKALIIVFLACFICLGIIRAIFFVVFPDVALQNETGFWGSLYTTFLQLTDPGNMAQDIFSSSWYKLFAVVAGIVGVVLLSSLIAFITAALEQKTRDLRQGHSKVIEEEHTLILGWNDERIIEILREIVLANESEDYGCVVILADKDKEEMDETIRLRISDLKTTRVVTRSGKTTIHANLEKVAIDKSKAIIILAECKDTDARERKIASDAKVIQSILATTGKAKEQTIVAEIYNTTYRDIVESTLSSNVVIVNTNEILAKLLVQTSRSIGLSVVYNEILSFDGCEIYFHGEDEWPDVPFSDLVFYFEDGVLLGYKDLAGEIHINPDKNYRMQAGEEIIIVADDDSTIILQSSPVASVEGSQLSKKVLEQKTESQLLIGWNEKSPTVIAEFSDYVVDGRIDVLVDNEDARIREEVARLNDQLENLTVRLVEKDYLNREDLLSLSPFEYDNIIIFSSQGLDCDAQEVDSGNIVCLLLLRHIFEEFGGEVKTKLITEVMDSQNQSLVARAGVKDVIISSRLLSMVLAQISENKDVKRIYDDIFEEDGSEIYLKPIDLYYDSIQTKLSFGQIIRQAQLRGEICIGVKIKAQEADAEQNFGVQLIPDKNQTFSLQPDDCLVVLAENEL